MGKVLCVQLVSRVLTRICRPCAAFRSVPFPGVCAPSQGAVGQSQLCCETAAEVIPSAAAAYSVDTFVGHEQGKQLSERSIPKERLKSLD